MLKQIETKSVFAVRDLRPRAEIKLLDTAKG